MTNSEKDLSYDDIIIREMDNRIEKCRMIKRHLLNEIGVKKLPKQLEDCIFTLAILEDMKRDTEEHPERRHEISSLIGNILTDPTNFPE